MFYEAKPYLIRAEQMAYLAAKHGGCTLNTRQDVCEEKPYGFYVGVHPASSIQIEGLARPEDIADALFLMSKSSLLNTTPDTGRVGVWYDPATHRTYVDRVEWVDSTLDEAEHLARQHSQKAVYMCGTRDVIIL